MRFYRCPKCNKKFLEKEVEYEKESFSFDCGNESSNYNWESLHCPFCNEEISDNDLEYCDYDDYGNEEE